MSIKYLKYTILACCLLILLLAGYGCFYFNPDRIANIIRNENYDDAIKVTTLGAKIFPHYSKWYSLRAYSEFQLQDYNASMKDYDKAFELETNEYKMMYFDNKIYIRYYLKDYEKALADFNAAIQNSGDDFEKDSIFWDKAQFLYNIGKYNEALNIYNELILKSDEDKIYLLKPRLYFERAQVYEKLGKHDLAKKDLEFARSSQMGESFENPIPLPTILLDDEI